MSDLRRHRLPLLIPLALALSLGYLLGSTQGDLSAHNRPALSREQADLFDAFWQAWELVHEEFVDLDDDTANPATLVDGAVRGMVHALGDEHSAYLDPQQYRLMAEDWTGAVEGIGAVVERDGVTGSLQIAWVLPETPAEAAGLQPGDVFAEVDGHDVLGASQPELALLVRGPVGSEVQLTLLRAGQLLHFTLTRAKIDIPNVEWRLLEDSGFGYVRLQHFNADARESLDEAFAALDATSLPGLVLDLRGNPGGLLESAISVASAFIEAGPVLIEDLGPRERVRHADGSHTGLATPLVVLVDGRSASASELVAGALQQRGRATLVGEQTYGKGSMQNLFELTNGGALQLTVARWRTPDGQWIHGAGITPDLQVAQTEEVQEDLQLQAAVAHLQARLAEAA